MRQCGVADAVKAKGRSLWGVVFMIDEKDVSFLDKNEGYAPGRPEKVNSYLRVEKHVYQSKSDLPLTVWTYVANREDDPPLPHVEYLELIIRGAQQWKLPTTYIEVLKETKVAR